ncbi:MAG: WG repeat-containing protein [Haliscomenobacter sp.]|nr:WG repeat-containing protein [Haliscomenobacter sp.]
MNRIGEVVIEPQYFEADEFYCGFSRIRMNDRLVLLDPVGRLYLKSLFSYIGYFEEDLARVQLVQRWGYIDNKGNVAIKVQFEGGFLSFRRLAVANEKQYGYIRPQGDWTIAPQFDWAGDFKGGMAPVTASAGCGYIDTEGAFCLELPYDRCLPFQNKVAVVVTHRKWGLIHRSGKVLFEPQFDFVPGTSNGDFFEGMAIVKSGNQFGFISDAGDFPVAPRFFLRRFFGRSLAP